VTTRRVHQRNRLWLGLCLALGVSAPAAGFSAFDERVEAHGFYEMTVRSIVRDFEFSDDWDLTQWYHILNVEVDADVAPDGWGPFDLITVFARLEVRYDCVWTQACTIFHAADAYRIGHKRRLPKRLVDGTRTGFSTNNYIGDRRHYYDVPLDQITATAGPDRLRPEGSRNAMEFWQTPLGSPFFSSLSYGLDGIAGTPDDLGPFYFDRFVTFDLGEDGNIGRNHCNQWGVRNRPGRADGRSAGDPLPLNPACKFETIGALRDKPNPFSAEEFNPQIGSFGAGELPYRPVPDVAYTAKAPKHLPQGLSYPNFRLQQLMKDSEFDRLTNTLRRADLAWNRGDAQRDQGELKELYTEFEMFDSRLWVRAGYQTIVWGKTELFRNQDQFNPQDLALGSLTSLEESRISLWAVRALWSFYDVGPLQDVRLELAANYDQYQPNDFGICGEPYTALAACALITGQIAHGLTGVGLAGAIYPPDAWNSWKGIEVGARVEWRWERFSFAVTDFYGHMDTPYASRIYTYSRNVDPETGRPRHTETTGRCDDGTDSSCLRAEDALLQHSANQGLFSLVCAASLAVVPALDPTACLANIFGSQASAGEGLPRVVVALNMILSGDGESPEGIILPGLSGFTEATTAAIRMHHAQGLSKVTVGLNRDVNDGPIDHPANHPLVLADDYDSAVVFFQDSLGGSISDKLTDEQEALFGCGRYYGTSCDLDGVDFLNMEASAVFQSFPNVSPIVSRPGDRWSTLDAGRAQPGTVGFDSEAVCTRFEGGKTYTLPGCRGPGDPGYDPRVDGTTTGLLQPFTGQQFASEIAAASWNTLMGLVASSPPPADGPIPLNALDVNDPFRSGGCSFAEPQWCLAVAALFGTTGIQRNSIRAGGNGRYGRRDFIWHSGGDLVLRTEKANVLGFSMDFAEDVTKSNWGVEFTWWDSVPLGDNDQWDGISDAGLYRLTISVDRPTFVNFLNANRTFFVNTQWFVQYVDGWEKGMSVDGPWSFFGVFAIATGYFQDRLLSSLTLVYFVNNNSFAVLPQLTYRYTENFSVSFGVAAFAGRDKNQRMPINPILAGNGFGRHANSSFVENGLSVIRERDEIYLRLRYTF
jgi:hypothetical protein